MRTEKEFRDIIHREKMAMQTFVNKEADGPLSPEDIEKFGKHKANIDATMEAMARMLAAKEDDADDADEKPNNDDAKSAWNGDHITTKNAKRNNYDFGNKSQHFSYHTDNTPGVPRERAIGRYVAAKWWKDTYGLGAAREMIDRDPYAKGMGGDPFVTKMLSTSSPIIPQDFYPEIIPLLQEESVFRKIARTIPMSEGNLTWARQRLGSNGQWVGEAQAPTPSQLQWDNLQFTWHQEMAYTYCTRQLLEFSPLNAASEIERDLSSRLGLLEDRTFLYGAANTAYAPTGLINQLNASQTINSTGGTSPTFQTVAFDLNSAILQLTGNLVKGNFTWVMHPQVPLFLSQLSSTYGVFPFKDEVSQGRLLGFPIVTTVQLPTNLGSAGANQTDVLLICGDMVIIADAMRYAIEMTTEASFYDNGVLINPFSQNLVAWKVGNSVDMQVQHDVAAAVISATSWGLTTLGVAAKDSYIQAANTQGSFASSAVL